MLAAVLASQLMLVLDSTVVTIALPEIGRALEVSAPGLSWVVNAYTLVFGGLLLLGARSGDLFGRRRTYLAGIAVFVAASLVGGFAPSTAVLVSARAVQGVGGALAAPSALALLTTTFTEPAQRARSIALYVAVSIGGGGVGLIAGGLLTQLLSWRWVLFVNVPLGLLVLAIGRIALEEADRHPGRFDLLGAVTSTAGMTALVLGFVRAASVGWENFITAACFMVALLLIGVFVAVERRAPAPITPLRLFLDRNRSVSYVGAALVQAATSGMFFFLSQFVQRVLQYSPIATGAAFLPLIAVLFVASNVSGRLTSRSLSRGVLVLGLLLSAGAAAWLTQLSGSTGYGAILGPLLLFGAGNGLALVPLTGLSLEGVPPSDAGAASGLLNAVQQVGAAIGLAVLVTVFGLASRVATAGAPPDSAPAQVASRSFSLGADRVFAVATGFLLTAALLVALLVRRPTE